jgi:hypothetical protein
MSIACVISFCSNDYRFIDKAVEEAKKFSTSITIITSTCFFDGKPENDALLQDVYARHPDCAFIQYAYHAKRFYNRFFELLPNDPDEKMYRYANLRYLGYLFSPQDADYIFFLDADEIVDGERMKNWLSTFPYTSYNALFFECFYYFRDARQQALTTTETPLLAKRSSLALRNLFTPLDRMGTFCLIEGEKVRDITDQNGDALIHHYCWVRNKEEFLQKVETHAESKISSQRTQVEEEFTQGFRGADFDLAFAYREVEPFFDPLSFQTRQLVKKESLANLTKIDHHCAFQREIELEFNL